MGIAQIESQAVAIFSVNISKLKTPTNPIFRLFGYANHAK